ncbi:carbohydrate ABC transporter permease [Lachnotalea sp. AF33-28]|uniref:carbohydrate ABC transporter permease n=1 Tax=Lachnotalea sp. AF33-28 TaxID=2292046 RepID=UPI000E4B571C|nr:sugar ABC transporter permease [Lachnotalea sp. AF33-28]RHP32059.1 sugar ABC transporter permease [Lachnotalea sp. AF33-28]
MANKSQMRKNTLLGYLFIGPWLICFLAFTALPFAASFFLSFTEYNMLSVPKFIGFSNYIRLFTQDNLFMTSLGVTFKFVFISIPLRLLFALMVAMILNRDSKAVPIYRVIYYLPSILGGSVAVSVMWKYCFSKTGVFNSFLNMLGIPCNISWISNKDTALWSIILLFIWQFGSPMLIFLSGLKQIPRSYYEAAVVDGAGPVKKFFRITLPLLSPIIFFNLVMQMIGGFMVFSQAMIITDGGPMNKTLVYALYLYRQSFAYYKMGYGCAMAWILLVIIGFFTALVFKSSSAWVFYENEMFDGKSNKRKGRARRK